jgi:glucosamine--fructose-6-phosphate aminotransferase (isomerizing)
MCGIFGFITRAGAGPNPVLLKALAASVETRGHHAFGLAWVSDAGRLRIHKRPGRATAAIRDLDRCRGSAAVIGHCRWATHGSAEDNRNNHPHPAGSGWFVHNGVVSNYLHLAARYRLARATDCDSEVLGLLMARFAGPLGARAAKTTAVADGPLAVLGLWRRPIRLVVARRGNPLHFGETAGGIYFASLPDCLPGRVLSLPDGYVGVLSFDGVLRPTSYRLFAS